MSDLMKIAQITGINQVGNQFTNPINLVGDVVSRVLLFAISFAGLLFFYQLLTSGISYLTSTGDEMRLRQIQKQLTNAAYGLLIVIASYFIIQIVQKITGTNLL
jgi:hypothetical protein